MQAELSSKTDCEVCGWAADTVHTDFHERRCNRWRKAIAALDYKPMLEDARDAMHAEAKKQARNADTPEEERAAALKFARVLFDRSLAAAMSNNTWEDHPSFNEYVCMLSSLEGITDVLREEFPHRKGEIAEGYTYWEPSGSKERKLQFRMAERDRRY